MKLIIQNSKIAGTATDAYSGPEAYIDAPDGFYADRMGDYVIENGVAVLPAPDVQAAIVAATQARLDAFAQQRGYDGILSACTYATSSVPKFMREGQDAVNARDATWAALYTIMGQVQAGALPIPSGFADVEPLLPVLEWTP